MNYPLADDPGRGRTEVDNQSQRLVEADARWWRRTRARRAARRSRDAGRDEGLEARRRQRVHHLVQLLLVRVRHDRRRSRRQAPDDGGRLRPHRQSRSRCASKASPCTRRTPLPSGLRRPATGRRAATTGRRSPGTTRSRGSRRRSARRATRRGSPPSRWIRPTCPSIALRVIGSRTPRTSSLTRAGTRGARQSHRRHRLHGRRAEHERRVLHLSESGPAARPRRTSNTRPDFDIARRSPVWGPHSVAER